MSLVERKSGDFGNSGSRSGEDMERTLKPWGFGRKKESSTKLRNLGVLEFRRTEKRAKEGTSEPRGSKKEEGKQRKRTSKPRGSGVPEKERKKGLGTWKPRGSGVLGLKT